MSRKALLFPAILTASFAASAVSRGDSRDAYGILPRSLDPAFASVYSHAITNHPAILAAGLRAESAYLKFDAFGTLFKTPTLNASLGYSAGADDVPGVSIGRVAPEGSVSVGAGVEAPVGKGVYAGVGAAQRFLTDSDEADAQTAVGARLRVPLIKDFGYALNEHESQKLRAEAFIAEAEQRRIRADVSREIFLAWNLYLRSAADTEAVAQAVRRAEKLLDETSERAKFQDVAGYQLFPAQYEVALRKEELQEARQNTAARLETLREKLGFCYTPVNKTEPASVISAPSSNAVFAAAGAIIKRRDLTFSAEHALNVSPAIAVAGEKWSLASMTILALKQSQKDTLDFTAGAGFRGETANGIIGTDGILTKDTAVFEIGLTYKRPLGRTGFNKEIEAANKELEAVNEEASAVQNEVVAALVRAQITFASACGRLELAQEAIARARDSLEAEESRFNLGEGSSRNVLDAQKDLTNATRRGISVAGAVADALVELLHAAGADPFDVFENETDE